VSLDLPKRSPDLNPLDFSFWSHLSKRMRAKEKSWPATRRETRKAYLARLRRTALSTPRDYVQRIIGALHKRCGQVAAAKGSHIAEGGT
jgi:hypothetical protein